MSLTKPVKMSFSIIIAEPIFFGYGGRREGGWHLRVPKQWLARLGLALAALACAAMVSCAGGGSASGGMGDGRPEFADPEHLRTPPALKLPQTGSEQTTYSDGQQSAMIDTSNVSQGYVGASCTAGSEVRLRVQGGEGMVDFYLDNTGRVEYFPLSYGDGSYAFSVLIVTEGTQAIQFLTAQASVTLESQLAPFLVPNKTVHFDESSSAVALSYELAEHASSDLEVIQQVYYWVKENVVYDTAKAQTVQSNLAYTPSPDETLQSKTGICYDYASLVAAMLRANGIPCQLVMGMVDTGEGGTISHAWNMVWTTEEGWIAVEVPATPEEWERIDLTFAASGNQNIAEFVGDGSHYAPMETR